MVKISSCLRDRRDIQKRKGLRRKEGPREKESLRRKEGLREKESLRRKESLRKEKSLQRKGDLRKKERMYIELRACGIFAACALLFSGCTLLSEEKIKLRDLEFTVISEEKIPEQLKTIIEEKKAQPFQITYTDNKNLYICIGYGEQETGGYSIAVNELYLTDTNICVSTSLLGPEPGEKNTPAPSYPVIVIKTEFLEQTVMFE